MDKKRKIVQYRERLDRTLASPDLTNTQMLKKIVNCQLLGSSKQEIEEYKDNLVEAKTAEVSKILDLLRSASVDDSGGSSSSHTDWKIKHDNEEFRVMYREGPEGTPFHTLLVEGYVDGPIDVCLSLSWEAHLYKKWWPQSIIPAFKVTVAECLQKIQIGEQISLVRMKLSWPLSTREAVMHYYVFEYFQDDLVLVLLNTVPESKGGIAETIYGFNSDVIPEAKDAVRIDVVGGFVLQKVTPERSYFRTIANMDIKLDFVPPSLINFISRQLIGSGFRLYQKAVASKMNHDEELRKALEDPLYVRIREALYNINGPKAMNREGLNQVASILSADGLIENKQDQAKDVSLESTSNKQASNFNTEIVEANGVEITEAEIEEIAEADKEEIVQIEEDKNKEADSRSVLKGNRNVYISSEVRQALGTLEKAISVVREFGFRPLRSSITFANEGSTVDSHSAEHVQTIPKTEVSVEASNSHVVEEISQEEPGINSHIPNLRHTQKNPSLREVNYNKIVPAASPEQNLSRPIEAIQVDSYSLKNGSTLVDHARYDNKQLNTVTVKDVSSNGPKKSTRQKSHRYCCFLH